VANLSGPALLDAGPIFQSGTPTVTYAPPPAGGGYSGGTTILVQPNGGRVELTEHNSEVRMMSYADGWASQAPIAAVIEKMRRRISMLPRKVYQHAPGNRVVSMPAVGSKPPRTRKAFPTEICDPSNSLCDLIWHPLEGYGEMSLAEWQYLSLFVNGGSLIAKYRGNGPTEAPTELVPLDWRYLQAWARLGHPLVAWATTQTGQWEWLLPSEALFTSWSTVAGAQGAWFCTSPLEQLSVTIKIDEAAQRYAAAYFKNAARPGGIISLDKDVNVRQQPEISDRLQKKAEENYGGVDNNFRVAVLGGGASWQPWGNTAQEAQMVETREIDFRETCAVLDMPFDAMFGTMAATPEGEAQVWKAVGNWAKLGDDRFNAQVVQPEAEWAGMFVKTDLNEVLYGDPLVLSDKVIAEAEAGLISRNEAREALGREPRDDPGMDECIYNVPSAGIVGDLPGSTSVAEEEREMVMADPGTEGVPAPPLEPLDTRLSTVEGG
jgi:hypothetical protein